MSPRHLFIILVCGIAVTSCDRISAAQSTPGTAAPPATSPHPTPEPIDRTQDAPTQDAPTQDAPTQDAPTQDAPTQDAPTQDIRTQSNASASEETPVRFQRPLADAGCVETRLDVAHQNWSAMPESFNQAVAYRREDGREVRIVLSNYEVQTAANGRFIPPEDGQALFEFEVIRTRRRPLDPGSLYGPDSRRRALTHARFVTSGPFLTFGTRYQGEIEITEIDRERICGRIDLNDGFGRVRGNFQARVIGLTPN